MTKISVIIPVYNHEKYIAESIESVLNQSYKDFEIVVVDDGSTDRTPEILRDFGCKIKYIRQENKGGAAALNTAIRNSTGEYLAWVSSDDVFMPTKLEDQIKFFNENPGVDLTYADFYIIDKNGEIKREVHSPYYSDRKTFVYNMLIGNFINGSSVMFKRSCIEKVGYFDEEMKYHADGNMWFRMLKHYNFGHIPKPLLKYRWHNTNLSHDTEQMKRYLAIHYKKVFSLYKLEEIFDPNIAEGQKEFKSYSYRILADILFNQKLYTFAFAYMMRSLKASPFSVSIYLSFLFLLLRTVRRLFL